MPCIHFLICPPIRKSNTPQPTATQPSKPNTDSPLFKDSFLITLTTLLAGDFSNNLFNSPAVATVSG